jgi:antitoxin CptB
MSEPPALRRKRLIYRSRYRGTLESDLILGRFADLYVSRFDERQLDRYEALLEQSDDDLLRWLTGRAPAPPELDHDVLALLRAFSPATTS